VSQLKKLVFSSKVIPLVLTAGLGLGVSLYVGLSKTTANPFNFNNLTAIGAIVSPINVAQAQQPTDTKVVRIGYQKYGTINLLKAKGTLEPRLKAKGVTVEWSLFPAGPQLLEALNAGKVDFGSTGEAPPIFAQAAGAPLVYVGNEPPNPKGEAILVQKDSPIKTIRDLKGKTIALNKGSNVHYFLVKAVEEAGLKYSDVKVAFLPPGDARPAFEKGSVDAWAIWDPFYTSAKRALNARVLKDGQGLVANREFYLAAKPIVTQHPERIKAILEELNKVDSWAKANPKPVAELLSPQLNIDVPSLEEISRRRPYGVQTPVKPDVVKYQQSVADVFHKLGLIPKPIKVKDVVLNKKL
jgi:sulfonate transport system substrate-binding protein